MEKQSISTLLKEYHSSLNGLTQEQAEQNKKTYGTNELEDGKKKTVWGIILSSLKEPMIYILVIASIISIVLKEYFDSIVIFGVIIINTIISVIQEYKAEKTLENLKKLSNPKALVKRDGKVFHVEAKDLVPGDIVYLESGDVIPADMILMDSVNLKVEEASLTGESLPVEKEKNEEVYMSCYVTYGRGHGLVFHTGMNSKIGSIASMLNKEEDKVTPMQKRLADLSTLLGAICLIICAVLFILSVLEKRNILEMLITSISLAVASIPEGLPAVVTIVLALGVQRMSKNNAIVRKLHAVETLGTVSVICTDKTGTLTQNKMRVVETFSYQSDPVLFEGFLLCNDVLQGEKDLVGDPTEIALVNLAMDHGLQKKQVELQKPRVSEIPFDSKRKLMTTVHQNGSKYIVYTKGAADQLLNRCDTYLENGMTRKLDVSKKAEILRKVDQMCGNALRVLGVAMKTSYGKETTEENLTFIGLAGMIDPPKEGVKESIALCNKAGIKVVMITGDHPETALKIAQELKIAKRQEELITGDCLNQINEREITRYSVFARVSPEHKVRIVEAFKKQGNIVAMTGDGINDAPSLKKADIGISMGITGTDVTKEASDIILVDDDFSTIVTAVEEGRNIYLNIQKAVLYLLSCNIGEVVTLLFAIILLPSFPVPLLAVQILWVNLITDAFPALALGVDPKDKFVMEEQPRRKDETLFSHGGYTFIIINGLIIGIASLVAFKTGMQISIETGRTMCFMVLAISQLFHVINLRSRNHTLMEVGIFKNKVLLVTVLLSMLLQISITLIPTLRLLLKVTMLSFSNWLIVFALSFLVVVVNEFSKLFGKE